MTKKLFYTDPYTHIRSFLLNGSAAITLSFMAIGLMGGENKFDPTLWHVGLIPIGIYLGGLSAVWIHNASHGSFSSPLLTKICGHLAGWHQLWGFFGWKFIHMQHHQYSDTSERDPHSPNGLTFPKFFAKMFLHSSVTISKRYIEQWGNSKRTWLLQRTVLFAFPCMAASILYFWYVLLGANLFVFLYLPSLIFVHFMFAHINYYCHPQDAVTGTTSPANLTHGWYYNLANRLWYGIYYHGNHHKRPLLFNPQKWDGARTVKSNL